jgi:23S rRNA (cytosine1962-C5)-methyltransferase
VHAATDWQDYTLIDAGGGEKLENWAGIILRRPDPVAVWPQNPSEPLWKNPHATYRRSNKGGGSWQFHKKIPTQWQVAYHDLRFHIKPTPFKHTGLFPEQAVNWEWLRTTIAAAPRSPDILNLFAYTGAATVAAASVGASLCHVDASKSIVTWARENLALSGLADRPVRWIVDDAQKFLEREHRRGKKYHAIIMDPPSYGRGSSGEVWQFEDHIARLLTACVRILSDNPLFLLINSYTAGFSPLVWPPLLESVGLRGKTELCELALPIGNSAHLLPCGTTVRWRP